MSSCHLDYKQPPPDKRGFQRGLLEMGTEPESVDAQKGTMKDVLARCLKKDEAQVCTLLKMCALSLRGISTLLQALLEDQHSRLRYLIYVHVLLIPTMLPPLCTDCIVQ